MARKIESTINLFPHVPTNVSNMDKKNIFLVFQGSGYLHVVVIILHALLKTITLIVVNVCCVFVFNCSCHPNAVRPSIEKWRP